MTRYLPIAFFIGIILSLIVFQHLKVIDLKDQVKEKDKEIKALQRDKATRSLELSNCVSDLQTQNDTVELIAKEYALGLQEMEKLRAQSERVRYEKIYEIKEMESDECEDIKRGIDLLRDISVGM